MVERKRKYFYLTFFSLAMSCSVATAMVSETLVLLRDLKYKTVNLLASGDSLASLDVFGYKVTSTLVRRVKTKKCKELIEIQTKNGSLRVGKDKIIFEGGKFDWKCAKDFFAGDYLLSIDNKLRKVIKVTRIKLEHPVILYEIKLKKPSTYFIIDTCGESYLVHNGFGEVVADLFRFIACAYLSSGNKAEIIATAAAGAAAVAAGAVAVCQGLTNSSEQEKKDEENKRGNGSEINAVVSNISNIHSPNFEEQRQLDKAVEKVVPGDKKMQRAYANAILDSERKRQDEQSQELVARNEAKQLFPGDKKKQKEYIKDKKSGKVVIRIKSPKPPKKDDDDEEKAIKDAEEKVKENIDYRKNSIDHIFTNKGNHLRLTRSNVIKIKQIANDPKNFIGKTKIPNTSLSNHWYAKINEYGEQLWVRVHNGKIVGAGKNPTPRPFDPETGFCKPVKG